MTIVYIVVLIKVNTIDRTGNIACRNKSDINYIYYWIKIIDVYRKYNSY